MLVLTLQSANNDLPRFAENTGLLPFNLLQC